MKNTGEAKEDSSGDAGKTVSADVKVTNGGNKRNVKDEQK